VGRRNGFTLIELMIVVSIIAALATIAAPNLLSARLNANETAAVATLRNVSSAQAQFQASARCDVDNDGAGEFGLFREMSGGYGVRITAAAGVIGRVMDPPVLSGAFRALNAGGEASRSGYFFHMVLPGTGGIGVTETATGTLGDVLDTTLCETTWCCYAWPSSYSKTGNRSFFVSQAGDIVGVDDSAYSGAGKIVAANAGAAFKAGGPATNVTGQVAVGTRGRDGNVWKQIN
jgi:prepilin-type N-terminal cleavage/methylation domain-containing protein